MKPSISRALLLSLTACFCLTVSPARAEEPAASREATPVSSQPPTAPAATAKAPSAAYIIEENQDSRVAKREVPGGWKEVDVKGVVYWCQEKRVFGSRTQKETTCVTPQQFDQMQRDSQKFTDKTRENFVSPKSN
jgi:hypothetical protein